MLIDGCLFLLSVWAAICLISRRFYQALLLKSVTCRYEQIFLGSGSRKTQGMALYIARHLLCNLLCNKEVLQAGSDTFPLFSGLNP